jgi:hypothetical protein
LTVICLEKPWLNLRYHDESKTLIKKPEDLENEMQEPPAGVIDENILDRITGSMVGMALGDALGAHVEFRPRQYMIENPVKDLEGGGTWGLRKGQVLFILSFNRSGNYKQRFFLEKCQFSNHFLLH